MMNCKVYSDTKIILVPLEDTEKEDLFYDIFLNIVFYCYNLCIYWEALDRENNEKDIKNQD